MIHKFPIADVPVEQSRLPVLRRESGFVDVRIYMAVDHDDVFAPVVVDIGELHAPSQILAMCAEPGPVREIGERAVAESVGAWPWSMKLSTLRVRDRPSSAAPGRGTCWDGNTTFDPAERRSHYSGA
jgi:hypothetical protein